ncbi:hypothetical protein TRFO_33677 [Tritrichomonas foetus]|uniref:CWH43-like N-terminal domain-containing protein n=1 Tax=Tritrichomonas foetus TaxID=1144522 RepID=A0A1J4JRB3_9EUKA|nr:hypothetical protein TRFO_33677 [Tritrichomonas foetus]|eukprot:OHS99804.1 hypothetical protein TRFO_33677 [Tritrichomonas foetus]
MKCQVKKKSENLTKMQKEKPNNVKIDEKAIKTCTKNQVKNSELPKINIPLNIPHFAFISFLYPPMVGVFCFVVYAMQGRIAGYFPTISETGTQYPNNKIFGQFMSTGALTTMLTLFCYYCYFRLTHSDTNKKLKFLRVFIFGSGGGIIGLGFSPINENHDRHLLSAVCGFLSILIFELLILTDKHNPKSSPAKKKLQIGSLLLAFSGFALFAASKYVFDYRFDITISSIAEWILLVFMLLVWATWSSELGSLEMSVVLL